MRGTTPLEYAVSCLLNGPRSRWCSGLCHWFGLGPSDFKGQRPHQGRSPNIKHAVRRGVARASHPAAKPDLTCPMTFEERPWRKDYGFFTLTTGRELDAGLDTFSGVDNFSTAFTGFADSTRIVSGRS